MHHTPKSYWILGCQGSFGIIDQNKAERLTYPILSLHKHIQPTQLDSCNCGVIWCLFMYDLMMQVPVPYTFDRIYKEGYMLLSTRLGKTWTEPSIYNQLLCTQNLSENLDNLEKQQNYCQTLFHCFCDKIVILLE